MISHDNVRPSLLAVEVLQHILYCPASHDLELFSLDKSSLTYELPSHTTIGQSVFHIHAAQLLYCFININNIINIYIIIYNNIHYLA